VCQQICEVAEGLRDRANEATVNASLVAPNVHEQHEGIREAVWKSLHFPRYRFFDAAMPFEAWAQFATDTTTAYQGRR
jgi:hypothetical protein